MHAGLVQSCWTCSVPLPEATSTAYQSMFSCRTQSLCLRTHLWDMQHKSMKHAYCLHIGAKKAFDAYSTCFQHCPSALLSGCCSLLRPESNQPAAVRMQGLLSMNLLAPCLSAVMMLRAISACCCKAVAAKRSPVRQAQASACSSTRDQYVGPDRAQTDGSAIYR